MESTERMAGSSSTTMTRRWRCAVATTSSSPSRMSSAPERRLIYQGTYQHGVAPIERRNRAVAASDADGMPPALAGGREAVLMYPILYIIGAIVVIVVRLRVLGAL